MQPAVRCRGFEGQWKLRSFCLPRPRIRSPTGWSYTGWGIGHRWVRHRKVGFQGHGRGRRTRTAWICPPFPPTSSDVSQGSQSGQRDPRSGIQNRNFPFGRTPDTAWGKRSLREGLVVLRMKQVTPASDAPSSHQCPWSCWAASTALKRTTPAEHQLLPDNWPNGRPKLEMAHRRSDRQLRVLGMLMLAKLRLVLGIVWSSP